MRRAAPGRPPTTAGGAPRAPARPPAAWCVVPAYNNAGTVRAVAAGCRRHLERVLVIDDGSTDADLAALLAGTGAAVIRHAVNRGKGQAILTALDAVAAGGGSHAVTIDADGQHDPDDIPRLLAAAAEDPEAIVVGSRDLSAAHIPGRSRFGRSFSNFWLRLETGVELPDTQSGFRVYPVGLVAGLPLHGRRYDFEAEILTRAAWAGIPLRAVPIRVWYPADPAERVSSFRPFADNLRIARAHSRLVGRRLVPWPHRRLVRRPGPPAFWRHPREFLRGLLREHATPGGLAAAAFVGVFLGALPLVSFHMLAVLFVTARLNLNKLMALAVQNLCMPPVVPVACVELGYFLRHGRWLTEATRRTVLLEAPERLLEWLLGALVLGPVLGAVTAALVFVLARWTRRRTEGAPA